MLRLLLAVNGKKWFKVGFTSAQVQQILTQSNGMGLSKSAQILLTGDAGRPSSTPPPPPTPAPDAPVASAATATYDTQFVANWAAVSGAADYRIDVSTAADFSSFVIQNQTVAGLSLSVTGRTKNTAHYYRVRAVNANGTSVNSNTVTVTTSNLGLNLVAFYKMEENTTSDRLSAIGGAPNLVPSSSIARSAGKAGFAADTSGAVGPFLHEATNGNFDFTSDFTVSAWISIDDTNTDAFILGYGGIFPNGANVDAQGVEVGACWGLYYTQFNGALTFYAFRDYGTGVTVSTDEINSGFHHVSLTYDSTTHVISLYFDGSLAGSQDLGGAIIDQSFVGGSDFTVFKCRDTDEGFFLWPLAGRIDDLAIHNRKLTPTEIALLISAGNAGITQPF